MRTSTEKDSANSGICGEGQKKEATYKEEDEQGWGHVQGGGGEFTKITGHKQ